MVGKDLKIIANANTDRTGEEFNPDNLVSEVLNNSKQIKASRVVSWSELSKEAPPLPTGFSNQDALIRYTITPVKDPVSQAVIGALVSGDIVNGKSVIAKQTLQATRGGYSAVYFYKANGDFEDASSLHQGESQDINQALSNVELPIGSKSLLTAAAKSANGQVITARSSSATKEIENILENVQREATKLVQVIELETTQVVEGTRVVEDAKYSLAQILEVSRQVNLLVNSISNATDSQL